jgi:hypothetical protein
MNLRTLPYAATLLALPLFSLSSQSSELAAQRVRPAATPAIDTTADETAAWFTNEFARLAWATTTDKLDNGLAIRTFHRIRAVKLEGCTLTFSASVDTDSANVRGYRFLTYTIPLKSVNLASVEITRPTQTEDGRVRTEMANNIQVAATRGTAFSYTEPDYSSANFVTPGVITSEIRSTSIPVSDDAEAVRVARAVKQAAKLCGATASR